MYMYNVFGNNCKDSNILVYRWICGIPVSYHYFHLLLVWPLCLLACNFLLRQECRYTHLIFVVWLNQFWFAVNSAVIRLIVTPSNFLRRQMFECHITITLSFNCHIDSLCNVGFNIGVGLCCGPLIDCWRPQNFCPLSVRILVGCLYPYTIYRISSFEADLNFLSRSGGVRSIGTVLFMIICLTM